MRALVYEMTNPITNEVVVVKTLDEARTFKAQGYTQEFKLVEVMKPIFERDENGKTTLHYPNLWED